MPEIEITPELVDEIEAKARAARGYCLKCGYVGPVEADGCHENCGYSASASFSMDRQTAIALVAAYRNALARIVELEKDRDALVEALRSFGEEAVLWSPSENDGYVFDDDHQPEGLLETTVGDLRCAARVLEQVRGK